MVWLVFGAFALCGLIMMFAPDAWTQDASGARTRTVDRARIRRNGGMLFGLSVTVLVGWFVLNVLANWVASDL